MALSQIRRVETEDEGVVHELGVDNLAARPRSTHFTFIVLPVDATVVAISSNHGPPLHQEPPTPSLSQRMIAP